MIGAIIGDIVGSRFEFNNYRSKDFELFGPGCIYTDDSVMTIAVAKALRLSDKDFLDLSALAIKCMQEYGRAYPYCGYGGSFFHWIFSEDPKPYGSYGNGAAMRISPVGWISDDMEQVKRLSKAVTAVSHDHPESIKGAESVATAILLARKGKSMEEIKDYINRNYYKIDFTLDQIRDSYQFDESCQGTLPQAFQAFFESVDYEDALRNAVSVGGDSDTMACIAGGIAEAYYGVPENLIDKAFEILPQSLTEEVELFLKKLKE
ncbi:MAG TPA: ADP-ribosylglycohydrolase [Clostridiales bacterium]|jgi:ADP-ribosylglycohydrolase|nr:ADP-ribosylglycohydrolase [Clostridiales bacterium]